MTDKYKNALAIATLLFVVQADAQTGAGKFEVRKAANLTERERLWQNTSAPAPGLIEVVLDDSYGGVVEQLRVYSTPITAAAAISKYSPRLNSSFLTTNIKTEFVEDRHRTSLFFDVGGSSAMLTLWDFAAAGGSIVAIDEFQNSAVRGLPANLALVKAASGAKKVVWKITWISSGRQYEFWLAELNGPTRTPAQVISIAEQLVAN